MTFSPRTCAVTLAVTCWPLSLSPSFGSPSPPSRRTSGWNVLPSSTERRSTSSHSPSRTRYCFPPTAITAYVFFSGISAKRAGSPAPRAAARLLLGLLLGGRFARLGLGFRLGRGSCGLGSSGGLGGSLLRGCGLLLPAPPSATPSARLALGLLALRLRRLSVRSRLVAILGNEDRMRRRLPDILDPDLDLLADLRSRARDRDHIAVQARDRVRLGVEMRFLELDLELLARLDRERLRFHLRGLSFAENGEVIVWSALPALERETASRLLLELGEP